MDTPFRSLAIDLGNSSLKVGYFSGGELATVRRLPATDWATIDGLVTNLGIENIIYSTVANVPPASWIDKWKAAGCRSLPLGDLPLPFASDYETPETLGQDRIAAVAAAIALAPAGPRLVVDAGSCITFDLVDDQNRHRGGNISPGADLRLRAMHEFTARLPLVQGDPPAGAVGSSTVSALLHGGIRGCGYEIEGLYRRLSSDYPGLRLLLTGGTAPALRRHLSINVTYYPHLVLRGLHQILSVYVNQP